MGWARVDVGQGMNMQVKQATLRLVLTTYTPFHTLSTPTYNLYGSNLYLPADRINTHSKSLIT